MSDKRKMAFEVKWRIENIESWFETRDDTLYSPQFVAETLSDTRWKLSVSTSWQLAEKYLSLTLQRDVEDDGPEFIALKYELSYLSKDCLPLKSKSCTGKFASKTASSELNVKEIEILNESKETYLPRNALTVRCTLWKTWSNTSKGGHCEIRSVVGTKGITLYGAIDNFNRVDMYSDINFKYPSSEISLISFTVAREKSCIKFLRTEVKCNYVRLCSCSLFLLDAKGVEHKICNNIVLKYLLNASIPISFYSYFSWNDLKKRENLQNSTLKLKLEIVYNPSIESECVEYPANDCIEVDLQSEDEEKKSHSNLEKIGDLSNEKNLNPTEKNESINKDVCFESTDFENFQITTFKEDMTSLFSDRLFCDTKLRNDTETFPAHRSVLSARSPVFKKMFTTDMKEAAGDCINVPDISSDTLRRMLQFLYTDCTGDIDMQSAMDLYVVSDKYDIASLKERCLSFMKKNLCPSNVCEALVLADMHQDKNLESAANEYVLNYDEEVFSSDEWKTFMQNYSGLAAQVMYLKCLKK